MDNQNIANRGAKRRRVNSSSAVQNQLMPRKLVIIFDDAWLEALKHITWFQWSKMCLVSRQVNGVIQRNLTRLPPPVIESAVIEGFNFLFYSGFEQVEASMARSLQLLFHPIVYFKNVTIYDNLLSDMISSKEGCYIRCHSFTLGTYGNTPGTRLAITDLSESLKWLERSVRSDSISFDFLHETVTARAIMSNFIFGDSQTCKVQELIFARCDHRVDFLNNLIEDFFAFPDVQSTIPTVVINDYPNKEQYRAHLGENLIGREVDPQGAYALYEIEHGDKRIRISFFYRWHSGYKAYMKFTAYVKFYTVYKIM